MAQTAAHRIDHAIPHVPVRQWVPSPPIALRPLLESVNLSKGFARGGHLADQKTASEKKSTSSETSAYARRGYLALLNAIEQDFCTIEVAFGPDDRPTDCRFVEVSPFFARRTGIEHGAGRSMREIAPDQDEHWFEIYGRVSLTGEPALFEQQSTPLGRWWSVYAFRIEDQPRGQIGVLFNEITDRKRREDYHGFLLKLSDLLRPLADPEKVQAVAANLLGAHLGVNRSYYGEVRGEYVSISHSYVDGLPPMTGSFRVDDYFGTRSTDSYRAGKLQVCVNTATDPIFNAEERQALQGQHIGAYVAVPLVKEGEWVGTFGVDNVEPREWAPSEIELVREVAERTWAAVQYGRAEKALGKSEEKYRLLFDSVDEGFATVEVLFDNDDKAVDYVILETNQAHEKMSGMPRAFVGKRVREVMPTIERSMVERVGRVALTGEPIRFEEYVGALGRWFEIHLSRVGGEGSRTVASLANNITERKRREHHAAFLDKLSQRLVSLDRSEDIVRATGEALDAYLDVSFLHLVDVELDHGDEPAEARFTMLATWEREGLVIASGAYRAGDYLSEQFLRAARAGETVVIRDTDTDPRVDTEAYRLIGIRAVVAVPILKDDAWPGLIAVCSSGIRDWRPDEVTLIVEVAHRVYFRFERVRADAALRASRAELAEADRRKDEFIAMLAHELRNPLAPIRTGLELIRLAGDTPGSVERVRAMMERQIGHMVRLIDDLLDVSRITSGKLELQPEPTPLNMLVNSAIEANRAAIAAKQIELSVDLPKTPCVLDVDPTRFIQVISNLLHNATKFTEPGGSLRVSAHVGGSDGGKRMDLSLSVIDSGIGMSAELLPRIFELFTQGERGSPLPGLGIGLALARRLVEMHGGQIDARSDGPGTGSEFVIRLPLSATDMQPHSAEHITVRTLKRRVVVIDDNHDAANTTAMLVEALGGECRVAYDGISGVHEVLAYGPEIVLLDIGMPGLDGYETCSRIRRELGRGVIVVALTGFGQEQDRDKAFQSGFDLHLTKPVNPKELAELLNKLPVNPDVNAPSRVSSDPQ